MGDSYIRNTAPFSWLKALTYILKWQQNTQKRAECLFSRFSQVLNQIIWPLVLILKQDIHGRIFIFIFIFQYKIRNHRISKFNTFRILLCAFPEYSCCLSLYKPQSFYVSAYDSFLSTEIAWNHKTQYLLSRESKAVRICRRLNQMSTKMWSGPFPRSHYPYHAHISELPNQCWAQITIYLT